MTLIPFERLGDWQPVRPTWGVAGFPVKHSLSPAMHNAALGALGIDGEYVAFEVPPERLGEAFDLWRWAGVRGVNLTVPHKEIGLGLVDDPSPASQAIGASNTVTFGRDGRTTGDNTDGLGFMRAVEDVLGRSLGSQRVALLGGGGAARAVARVCFESGCPHVALLNRSVGKLPALIPAGAEGRAEVAALGSDAARAAVAAADLVVNATSLGLAPGDPSPVPAEWLRAGQRVYDTIYNPAVTPLLRAAAEAGAAGCNGLSMLVHQGALAFEIWHGRAAPLAVMKQAIGCP
jgi:shikimate dehydrogenase